MKQLVEAIDHDDYWTGLSDQAARRKAQNRLNQRSRRRRQAPDKWTPLRSRIDDVAQAHQMALLPVVIAESKEMSTSPEPFPLPILKKDEVLQFSRGYFPLSTDHLIHLVQFNVFRALLANMLTLSITHLFSCETDTVDWLRVSALPLPATVPPSLEPTALQRQVQHAPFVDLFPLPSLRDALIRAECSYDDGELYLDLIGSISQPSCDWQPTNNNDSQAQDHGRNGLIVWGEPWRIESWEVEEGFVRKWGWMLKENCEELLQSTNRWRQLRGEKPLRWADWGFAV